MYFYEYVLVDYFDGLFEIEIFTQISIRLKCICSFTCPVMNILNIFRKFFIRLFFTKIFIRLFFIRLFFIRLFFTVLFDYLNFITFIFLIVTRLVLSDRIVYFYSNKNFFSLLQQFQEKHIFRIFLIRLFFTNIFYWIIFIRQFFMVLFDYLNSLTIIFLL